MITVTVGEFKANFSKYYIKAENGEKIAVSYGKKKEIVGMLVPMEKSEVCKKIKLGTLREKGGILSIMPDFEISDEELLGKKLYD